MNFIRSQIMGIIALVVLVLTMIGGGGGDSLGVRDTSNITNPQTFEQGLTEGGGVASVSEDSGTVTLTQAQLADNKVIRFTGGAAAAALTATLPAVSTLSKVIPDVGDTRTWILANDYTAAATTTTIAAGAGIDLQEVDGGNVVIGINNYAYLTCMRESTTVAMCRVDESIPAD